MPSQCECLCVSIICTFGLVLHTLIWLQHIYPVSVHRTHSLFSRETNHYGFSAVDVKGHRSKCVCVLVFSSSFEMKTTVSFSSTWLPNACTTVLVRLVLISSAVILGFLLWVSQRWSLSEMENSVIFSPSCHFFFSFFRTQNETFSRMFMLFFLKGCLRAFSL